MKKMMLVTVISGAVMVGQTMVMAGEQVSVGKATVGMSAGSGANKPAAKSMYGKFVKVDAEKGSLVIAIPQETGVDREETILFTKDTKFVKKANQAEQEISAESLTNGTRLFIMFTAADNVKTASKIVVR